MRDTKILSIVQTFDEREWRACYKFLKYSSQKEAKSLQVFEYLLRHRKKLNSPRLDRKYILKSIFSGLDEKTFLNRLSDLVKDVEQFMVFDHLKRTKNNFEYKILLAEVYRSKGTYKNFQSVLKRVQNDIETTPSLDLFRDFKILQIHHSLYFSDFYERYAKPVESLMEAEKRIRKLSKNLLSFYRTEQKNLKNLHKKEFNYAFDNYEDDLTIVLEHYDRLTSEKDENSFQFLIGLIHAGSPLISLELNKAILLTLINFCFYKIKSGDDGMKETLANLYLLGLENELFLQNESLSEIRFLNIVDVISNSPISIDSTEFMELWIDRVVTDDKESVKNVALAMFSFAANDFNEVLKILSGSEISMTRINHSIRSRWMTVCSLCSLYPNYEQKEEILGAAMIYFKRHRKEMSDSNYKGSINLLKVVKMFWNQTNLSAINSFVGSCDLLVHRSWINRMLK